MENTINILVTSRQDEDREQIVTALSDQDDFCIAGIEKDETGAVIRSQQLKPDVLILDLPPSEISGPDLAPIIHRRSPSTAIVLITDISDNDYVRKALRSGISGVLLKQENLQTLADAVKIVSLNGYFVSTSISKSILNEITRTRQSSDKIENYFKQWLDKEKPNLDFSPVERGIITEIAQGFNDTEIAEHLNYSIGTIKNYIVAIKRKTNTKNRVQIAIYSLANGFVNFEND